MFKNFAFSFTIHFLIFLPFLLIFFLQIIENSLTIFEELYFENQITFTKCVNCQNSLYTEKHSIFVHSSLIWAILKKNQTQTVDKEWKIPENWIRIIIRTRTGLFLIFSHKFSGWVNSMNFFIRQRCWMSFWCKKSYKFSLFFLVFEH